MSLREAAAFKNKLLSGGWDKISVFLSLMALLVDPDMGLCLAWCRFCLAVCLLLMTKEDAAEQTIDMRCLFALAWILYFAYALEAPPHHFGFHALIGTLFFGILRLSLTFWLTWQTRERSGYTVSPLGKEEPTSNGQCGYVPIFMLVFVLYLGWGTEWASFVFRQAAMSTSIMGELLEIFPEILVAAIIFWLLLTGWEVYRLYSGEPIVYALGGGDVVFLGLFAGYLGGGTLVALFFLSLIAIGIVSGISNVLSGKFPSI